MRYFRLICAICSRNKLIIFRPWKLIRVKNPLNPLNGLNDPSTFRESVFVCFKNIFLIVQYRPYDKILTIKSKKHLYQLIILFYKRKRRSDIISIYQIEITLYFIKNTSHEKNFFWYRFNCPWYAFATDVIRSKISSGFIQYGQY